MAFRTKLLVYSAVTLLGFVLLAASLLVMVEALKAALSNSQVQVAFAALVLVLVVLWWVWLHLPGWLRKLIQCGFRRKRSKRGGER